MKAALLLAVVFASSALAAIDINKPIAELKLSDGRTLRNVQLVSYGTSTAMAKWEGGRGTIAYELFPADYQAPLATMRPAPTTPVPKSTPAPAKPAPATSPVQATSVVQHVTVAVNTSDAPAPDISGQIFSLGFDQPFVFAAVEVVAYDLDQARSALDAGYLHPTMPEPRGSTVTDADGKFALRLPAGNYMLVAESERLHRNGNRALFSWRVPVTAPSKDPVLLNGRNAKILPMELLIRRH